MSVMQISYDETGDLRPGDYVHLTIRGDIWQVKQIGILEGLPGENMLTLEWVCGDRDPGRICKFSDGQARRVNAMEVIALMAS